MERDGIEIEAEVREELTAFISLLLAKPEIRRYQAAEQAVEENEWIQEMIEKIKQKQKELVNFEYYEKPNAFQKAKQELDQLDTELANSLSVQTYREALWEANEIVQLLFRQLQTAVESGTRMDNGKR